MTEHIPIRTLVFMDLETAGAWFRKDKCGEQSITWDNFDHDATEFSDRLGKWIHADASAANSPHVPRIAEMTFLSVPRCLFEEAAENMVHRLNELDDVRRRGSYLKDESIKIDVATNLYTCQLNPLLNEAEWDRYERERRSNRLRRSELQQKNSFAKEWPVVHLMLSMLPKPACLIAHNGIDYDFRILLHELKRNSLLTELSIPAGVYFADSLSSFRNIEKKFHDHVKLTIANINWDTVQPSSSFSELPENDILIHENRNEMNLTNNDRMPHNQQNCDENDDDIEFLGADSRRADETEVEHSLAQSDDIEELPNYGVDQSTNNASVQEDEIEFIEELSSIPKGNIESDNRRSAMKRKSTGLAELDFDVSHPFRFLRRSDWCPAKKRRLPSRIIKKNDENQWYFSEQVSTLCLQRAGQYKLETLFTKIIGTNYKAHRAQPDSEALLQVALAYGQDFLNFIDEKYAAFPPIISDE